MLEAYKRSHKVKTCINFSTQEMFLQGLLRVQ